MAYDTRDELTDYWIIENYTLPRFAMVKKTEVTENLYPLAPKAKETQDESSIETKEAELERPLPGF